MKSADYHSLLETIPLRDESSVVPKNHETICIKTTFSYSSDAKVSNTRSNLSVNIFNSFTFACSGIYQELSSSVSIRSNNRKFIVSTIVCTSRSFSRCSRVTNEIDNIATPSISEHSNDQQELMKSTERHCQ